jgi:hypothetical protein
VSTYEILLETLPPLYYSDPTNNIKPTTSDMKARIESLQQCRHRLASVIPAFMLYLQFMSQSQCCLCHPPSAALKASSNTRYFGSTSTAAFVKPHATNLGRIRLTSLSSATVRPASEAQPSTSQSKYEVVAHSPVLGGDITRIRTGPDEDDTDDSGFLTALGVPTFAVLSSHPQQSPQKDATVHSMNSDCTPKRLGLEAILQNPNAFLLTNALSSTTCEQILSVCEEELGFGNYQAGKNNHGALQIVIPKQVADALLTVIGPHVDLEGVSESELELRDKSQEQSDSPESKQSYSVAGINRRLRVYRYAPNQDDSFAPHIDAGFPPGGVSLDDAAADTGKQNRQPYLHWDASHQYSQNSEVVSRLTVLIYLNEDFSGGHTKFYTPRCESDRASDWNGDKAANDGVDRDGYFEDKVIASIQPRAGNILVFPQAVSEEAVERARYLWPLHEGSPVISGRRPKYVIRTDVLFETNSSSAEELAKLPEEERVMFLHDDAVRDVFLPRSPAISSLFLHHVQPLYNPHMGGKSWCMQALVYRALQMLAANAFLPS